MRVLVFGDSITWGYSDSRGGWVDRLRGDFFGKDIKAKDQYSEPLIFNLGIGGDTLEEIIKRFEAETKARRWENLPLGFVIAIGVNDSRLENGIARSTIEEYRQQLEHLLRLIKNESVLFVGLTPVVDGHPHVSEGDTIWQNSRIKKFDDELRSFCQTHGVGFVPIWEDFFGKEKELLDDGLHPNDAGHALIAKLVKPHIKQLNKLGPPGSG